MYGARSSSTLIVPTTHHSLRKNRTDRLGLAEIPSPPPLFAPVFFIGMSRVLRRHCSSRYEVVSAVNNSTRMPWPYTLFLFAFMVFPALFPSFLFRAATGNRQMAQGKPPRLPSRRLLFAGPAACFLHAPELAPSPTGDNAQTKKKSSKLSIEHMQGIEQSRILLPHRVICPTGSITTRCHPLPHGCICSADNAAEDVPHPPPRPRRTTLTATQPNRQEDPS